MKISLNWLAQFVDVAGIDPRAFGEKLTLATAEVEDVETIGGNWPGVVTGKILEIWQHPQADRIRMTKVTPDGEQVLQVVCGAPNIEVGQIIPLATIGAVLPGDFKIKKGKIRGEESYGMICSAKELGLSEESEGIMVLPPDTPVGLPLAEALKRQDTLYTIDNKSLTHRPDCWGHYGLAREAAAILRRELAPLPQAELGPKAAKSDWTIGIEDPALAPRYSALLIDNVTVKPSPEWLVERLTAVGARPINLIVDLTNYVMLTLGEPLHAFDRAKLQGHRIEVRRAKAGETMRTLDGKERELNAETLVIADGQGPVALAGIMGGEESEVSEQTTSLLVEAAAFQPAIIRRASTRLGLRSDAAARFEKSLDPAWTEQALALFWHHLQQECPAARLVSPWLDSWPAPPVPTVVTADCGYIRQRLGLDVSDEAIIDILTRLQFGVTAEPVIVPDASGVPHQQPSSRLTVTVPGFRATKDISMADDLVEEIGRMIGYDNIPPHAPEIALAPVPVAPALALARQAREQLSVGLGFSEVYTYAFVERADLERLGMAPERHVRLANPITESQDRMRRSLLPNLLNVARDNWRHRQSFRLYELGTVFLKDDPQAPGLPTEEEHLMALVADKASPRGELYYQAKGAVERLLADLHVGGVEYRQADPATLPAWAHPGRAATIVQKDLVLGSVYELHPRIAAAFDLPGAMGVALLYVPALLAAKRAPQPFQAPPVYPQVPFDVSLLVPAREPVATVEQAIRQSERKHIQGVRLFDIYEGKNLPEGQKSVSYTVTFGAADHTLKPEETAKLQERVIRSLEARGYTVRQG